ncbi:MAG: hypothetical protein PHD05_09255 [Sphaerochaetaceae bacterium]|nr:hypothetical protein [Sphaerochaetaceae bacterium]
MGKFGFTSGKVKLKSIESNSGPSIVFGVSDTRAEILAEYPNVAKGSVYVSTAGELFIKVNTAGAATDWQKVTSTAAD